MHLAFIRKIEAVARKDVLWAYDALRQFTNDRCPAMAAALAFYAAFSLAPTLVIVIAVAGSVFGSEAARGQLFDRVNGLLGNQAAAAVQGIVENAHRNTGTGIAATISLIVLAVGASATFSSLNTALNRVFRASGGPRSGLMAMVHVRLVSFGLVLGVALLLVVSLVLDVAIQEVGASLQMGSPFVIVGDLVQLSVGLAILSGALGSLLKILPDKPVRWTDALVGGMVAALLFSAGKRLFALYLTHAGTASAFGAAGSLAVLLMWLHFSAAVLLLGAEFSAARARRHEIGSPSMASERSAPKIIPSAASWHAAALLRFPGGIRATVATDAKAMAAEARERGPTRPRVMGTRRPTNPANPKKPAVAWATDFWRKMVRCEDTVTRDTAWAILRAKREAEHAKEAVRRHPWPVVVVATGAGLAIALLYRRMQWNRRGASPRN